LTPLRPDRKRDMTGKLTRIDGLHLRFALRSGIARVLSATGLLNKINVYPVPDGDTGTNLSMTLTAVDQALARSESRSAGEVLAVAADAAVDGARGNSGAIMAEFLQGLADGTSARRRVNTSELALAFASADRYARGALDTPKEGTILTAISAVASSLTRGVRSHGEDFRKVLPAAIEVLREAVDRTRDTLPEMRKAGVVDAGAKGFLLLMEGVVDAAMGRPEAATAATEEVVVAVVPPEAGDVNTGEFRFCTECIIRGGGIDRRKLRDELAALGNSLVVANSRDKVKVHIHAREPAAVFELAARYGVVGGQKAEDMTRQAHARVATERSAVVVTDSGADLPDEVIDELGIHTVPLRLHFADRTFLDKVSMGSAEFLREVARSEHHPKTSQPAPGDLRRVYEFLASHYEHVIAISLLGRVSGTLQASRMAARRSSDPGRVTVIDSLNISAGQGLVVMYAAECARAGLTPTQIASAVQDAARRTTTWGMVTDLSWVSRGGRLPKAIGWLARTLPIAPVLRIGGGSLGLAGIARRGADPVRTLAGYASRFAVGGVRHRFMIAHAGVPDQARALRSTILERVPGSDAWVTELGAAASVHGGPGTLAIAAQPFTPAQPDGRSGDHR